MKAFLIFLSALWAFPGQAGTNVWIGSSSGGNWHEAGNWRLASPVSTAFDLSALTNGARVLLSAPVAVSALVCHGETNALWTIETNAPSAGLAFPDGATIDIAGGRLNAPLVPRSSLGPLSKTGSGTFRLALENTALTNGLTCAGGVLELRQGARRSGLGAFWRFENELDIGEDATVRSVAPLTPESGSTVSPELVSDGVSGKALHIGGTSRAGTKLTCFDVDGTAVPTGSRPFTFSFWIRPTADSGRGPNFVHVANSYVATNGVRKLNWGNGFYFGSVMDDTTKPFQKLGFYTCNRWSRDGKKDLTNEVAVATFDTPLTEGSWHHVVGTYSNRTVRLYVDGELKDEVTRPGTLWVATAPAITLSNWAANDSNHKYNGDIDEVQWLHGAWTPEEVRAEYRTRVPPVTLSTLRLGGTVRVDDGAALLCTGGNLVLEEGVTLASEGSVVREMPLLSATERVILPNSARIELANLQAGEPLDALFTLIRARSLEKGEGGLAWTLSPEPSAQTPVSFEADSTDLRLQAGETDTCWTSRGCRFNIGSLGCALNAFVQPTAYDKTSYGSGSNECGADGTCAFSMEMGSCSFAGSYSCVRQADNAIRVVWTVTPSEDVTLGNLAIGFAVDNAPFSGGSVTLGSHAPTPLPFVYGKQVLCSNVVNHMVVTNALGQLCLTIDLDEPRNVNVHDARAWGVDQFSFRIQPSGKQSFSAHVPLVFGMTVTLPHNTLLKAPELYVTKADSDWLPMPSFAWPRAGTALDFSRFRTSGSPAGRYGRVVRRGAHFEFLDRPGVPQRFYGVNLVHSTVTPTAGEAEFAAGLARLGYNTVRLHHHERFLVKGGDDAGATELDADETDRFDRLVAACVTNGLYLTTDLFVSREPIAWRSLGIDRDGALESSDFKNLVLVHEPAYSNLVVFTRNFLTHVNPYLGRSLAREPSLIGISLVNEGAVSTTPSVLAATYPPWQPAWEKWAAARGVSTAVPTSWTAPFRRFVQELETTFATRITSLLRDELGCLAPLTSLNGCAYPAAYMEVRATRYDYSDDHYYFDHPSFLQTSWQLPSSQKSTNPLIGNGAGVMGLVVRRLFGAPYCVTEYNFCGPNPFRAVGGLIAGALGAGQDWDGLWRFAWQHGGTDVANPTSPIGFFDLAGDPLNLASERAALCLFLRGDLAPLETAGAALIRPASVSGFSDAANNTTLSLSALRLAWSARLGHVVADEAPSGVTALGPFETVRTNTTAELTRKLGLSQNRAEAVTVDSTAGSMTVNTPCTVGGFVPEGTFSAGVLTGDAGDAPACLWASSLDGQPVGTSGHILLTHLTDAVNTGMTFDDSTRTILQSYGSRPVLMRKGSVRIRLALQPGRYEVRALAPDGRPRRQVPAEVSADGVLSFVCDVAAEETATWLYEIIRHPGFFFSVR